MSHFLHISDRLFRRCRILLMLCWGMGCWHQEAKGQISWNFIGETLTISGTGTMPNYGYTTGTTPPWYDHRLFISNVVIGDGVRNIGSYAFSTCFNLTSVSIPNSVTSIGASAFQNCSNLASITIPNSVNTIGNAAFNNCSSLASVNIPNSIATIGDFTFQSCGSLSSITIPNLVTTIGIAAFAGCGFSTVTIPNSVISIGERAFAYCVNLYEINVAEENPAYLSVNGILFSKDRTTLVQYPAGMTRNSYDVPASVTTIGTCAFSSCRSLTAVSIPESVNVIGSAAFIHCVGLTSATIPSSVTTMQGLFYDCTSLTCVVIGHSVTTMGGDFFNCTSLTNIINYAIIPQTFDISSTFGNVNRTICALYVPPNSVSAYRAAPEWGQFVNIKAITFSFDFDVIPNREEILNDVGSITVYPIDFVTNVSNVSDNCSNKNDITFRFVVNGIDYESLTFTCSEIGSRTVSIVAIDENNNRSLPKNVTFTISDRTPPVFDIISGHDIALYDDGSITVSPIDFVTNVSDNCSDVKDITFRFVVGGVDHTDVTFTRDDIGSRTVSIVAIDGNGNRSQPKEVTFTISGQTQPPVFDVISGQDILLDNAGRITVFPNAFVTNVSDNNLTFLFVFNGADHESMTFTCSDIGSRTVSIVAVDTEGNRSLPQAITFTIADRLPPVARCKPTTLYLDDEGKAALTAAMIDNGSADNCGIESLQIKRTSEAEDLYANSLDFDHNDWEASLGSAISVTLRTTDISGNEATCTSEIRLIKRIQPSELGDIPGIFTPNGDGFNDTWDIPAIDQYPEAAIRIFNRAKKLMVELKGAQMPWDGSDRNGNLLESGYYFYQIELQKGGKVISGYVTILR